MSKKYRLLHDMSSPMGCIDKGTVSIFWQEWYCFPYIGKKFNDDNNGWMGNSFMTSDPTIFHNWFEEIKQKERIGVVDIQDWFVDGTKHTVEIQTTQKVSLDKFPLIKQTIEQILNDEQPKSEYDKLKTGTLTMDEYIADGIKSQEKYNQPPSGEFITKEECERRERAAFFAGGECSLDRKHYTFESYKQSLKQ